LIDKIIIGTRGSQLAQIQASEVKSLLLLKHPEVNIEIKIIHTLGDKYLKQSIGDLGGKEIFTSELEKNLVNKTIDIAVHSLKDLPSKFDKRLKYSGSLKREDVRDVLISKTSSSLMNIPEGGIIATGSIRRKSQISSIRPDLKIVDIRGNIDTRLGKLDQNGWDGVVLAAAALNRMSLQSKITEYLDLNIHIPAPGQGALGLQVLDGRTDIDLLINSIIDTDSTRCCLAERFFLDRLNGNCSIPIGAYAKIDKNIFSMIGYLSDEKGRNIKYGSLNGNPKDSIDIANKLFNEINQ
tara:strand:- start:175 stop:1062 length:888 start_codon:yes stop_codon:yes gene_type:complete